MAFDMTQLPLSGYPTGGRTDRFGNALPELPKTGTRKHAALYKRAHEAGMKAGKAASPRAMIVTQQYGPQRGRQDYVADGVCGFAYIVVPARGGFAQWLRATEKGRKWSSEPGVHISVHEFGQSMERKSAYAAAFAKVLNEAGVKATTFSRMD